MKLEKLKIKFPVGKIIKHKCCNLKYKIIDYQYDLFGEYVLLKNIYKNIGNNKLNSITKFYTDILKEYKLYEKN